LNAGSRQGSACGFAAEGARRSCSTASAAFSRSIDGGLDEGRRYPLPGSIAFAVIDQACGVGGDVRLEFPDSGQELAHVRVVRFESFRIDLQVIDFLTGTVRIAVPEMPIDPAKRFKQVLPGVPIMVFDALGELAKDRDAHVIWNQSRTCSLAGAIISSSERTSSPPSVMKVISWLACTPCFLRWSRICELGDEPLAAPGQLSAEEAWQTAAGYLADRLPHARVFFKTARFCVEQGVSKEAAFLLHHR
jgi:hypothetical protein